ncbi:MAG TPA: M28 family peptidase [Gemmatimonadales bacterium]
MKIHAGIIALAALAAPFAAGAQAPAIRRAAATITPQDVKARVGIIADDSMGGRNTPSPGLLKTAEYVAGEFRRFGLKPGGSDGGYLMRYPIYQKKLATGSTISFGNADGSRSVSIPFGPDAALAGRLPLPSNRGSIVLVGGAGRLDSIPAADLRDRVVIFVGDWSQPGAAGRFAQLARIAGAARARGVVAVVNSDSAFSARFGSALDRTYEVVGEPGGFFSVAVREAAVTAQVSEAAEQFLGLRQAPQLVVQPMLDWEGAIALRDTTIATAYAPNVVGILEGSDPVLKNEYLVYSAHMDHIGTTGQPGAGCRAMAADSVCNGADDDASGTVGVLELAQAFTQRGARPRRSIIFLTVSGEEHGLWGSDYFVRNPPVPLPQIVADLNSDMIGRNWPDTIVAIGKEHSDLGSTLNRVNAAHPELKMTAIDDKWPEQSFYTRSDHYNFARRGVPVLFFFNGVHADYHRASDSPDKIDAEKESRIVKLFFYVGQEVANAAERPQWVPASYRTIVTP